LRRQRHAVSDGDIVGDGRRYGERHHGNAVLRVAVGHGRIGLHGDTDIDQSAGTGDLGRLHLRAVQAVGDADRPRQHALPGLHPLLCGLAGFHSLVFRREHGTVTAVAGHVVDDVAAAGDRELVGDVQASRNPVRVGERHDILRLGIPGISFSRIGTGRDRPAR